MADSPTCSDTPGWTAESFLEPGTFVGCGNFQVLCMTTPGAQQNCCKCKKECCGRCSADEWDPLVCGMRTLPPILAPGPRPTMPPSDTTTCLCSRNVRVRTIGGRYVTRQEQYAKSCPREIVPDWPSGCGACCSYISPANQAAMIGLLGLLALIPLGYCAYKACKDRQRQRCENEEEAAGNRGNAKDRDQSVASGCGSEVEEEEVVVGKLEA